MKGRGDYRVSGRYLLKRELGRGAMGQVWLAYDERLSREVAVKEIAAPDGVSAEAREHVVRRTVREAQAAARLSHPGIVTVHDLIEDGDVLWVVMELIPGSSLGQLVREHGRLEWERVLVIAREAAEALAHTHSLGVVHRDLKPDNIMISPTRTVITDFGIARIVDEDMTLTETGMALGTPHYMSPEQLRGEPAEAASDMWSLGATLFKALEGQVPFEGATYNEVMFAILTKPAPPAVNAGRLVYLIRALLSPEKDRRLSADEVVREITAIENDLLLERTRPSDGRPSELNPDWRKKTPAQRRLSPLRLGALGLALAALVTGAIFGFQAWGSNPGHAASAASTKLTQVWAANAPNHESFVGAWTDGGVVVVAVDTAVTGYSLATGKSLWTWKPPSGQQLCDMSGSTSGGLGLVGYGPEIMQCSNIVALKAATGTAAWAKPYNLLDKTQTGSFGWAGLNVSGSMGLASAYGKVFAIDMSTGTERWSVSASDAACGGKPGTGFGDAVSGGTVYETFSCTQSSADDATYQLMLLSFRADNGHLTAKISLPNCAHADDGSQWPFPGFVLVNCGSGSGPAQSVDAVSTTGALTKVSIGFSSGRQDLFGEYYDQNAVQGFAVGGSTLYVATTTNGEAPEAVTAFDLTTGKKVWSSPVATGITPMVFQADASGATVALESAGTATLTLAHFAATQGSKTVVGSVSGSASGGSVAFAEEDYYYLSGGKLIQIVGQGSGNPIVTAYTVPGR